MHTPNEQNAICEALLDHAADIRAQAGLVRPASGRGVFVHRRLRLRYQKESDTEEQRCGDTTNVFHC